MHTPESLYKRLDELGIRYTTIAHAPVFTVKEADKILAQLPPHGPCKNLFLKDKKNHLYLVVALCDTGIIIKELAKILSAPGLRFASPEQLMASLGVIPGAVTPFGLINDQQHTVTVILDPRIFGYQYIGIHPLANDATTLLTPGDIKLFINSCGNRIVELPGT